MAIDKPTVQYSIAKLSKEVEEVEPFSVALTNSKIITFPDLMAMESEESEELLERIEQLRSTWGVLDDWLSKDDAAALRAEKLTRAKLLRLLKAASKYYQDAYSDLGEDAASAR